MDLEDFKCNIVVGDSDCETNQLKKKVNDDAENEIKMLSESLRRIESALQRQTSILTKNTDYLVKLLEQQNTDGVLDAKPDFFPINNKANLDDIEEQLDMFSEADILIHIRATAISANVSKCLNRFFSTNFLHQINWDGRKNKMAIKTYRLFKYFFYNAFSMEKENYTYSDFYNDMRKGFRFAKSSMYRLSYIMRNKTKIKCEIDDGNESHSESLT